VPRFDARMADNRTLSQIDREASKHAAGRLVIQFRIERAARRVGRIAIVIFVVALILGMPGGRPLTDKLMPADWWTVRQPSLK
jgi:hypothetical protein